jgi:hypothetical protein
VMATMIRPTTPQAAPESQTVFNRIINNTYQMRIQR